jgi:hypothetical protein
MIASGSERLTHFLMSTYYMVEKMPQELSKFIFMESFKLINIYIYELQN